MSIMQRISSPTPSFFKKVRTIGIAISTAGGALLAACNVLPTFLTQAGGYMLVAGTIAAAVSQFTTKEDEN